MYRYTFHANAEAPAFRASTELDLYRDIQEITGRNPLASYPSVARQFRRSGRIYVAGARGRPGIVIRREQIQPDECEFCHGQPVAAAESWVAAGHSPYAPCPRCGERNV